MRDLIADVRLEVSADSKAQQTAIEIELIIEGFLQTVLGNQPQITNAVLAVEVEGHASIKCGDIEHQTPSTITCWSATKGVLSVVAHLCQSNVTYAT